MNRRNFFKQSGWSLAGLAASGTLLSACKNVAGSGSKFSRRPSDYKVFWGDIHNHCNLTYGHGELKDAFEAAKGQLDFVSVTPHALWPDIPGANDPRLSWVIDYHTGAFDRLRQGKYDEYLKMTKSFDEEGRFLTFVSYECHSMKYGDHVVLAYDQDFPLLECTSVDDLKKQLKDRKAFVTPHHMGYQEGFRGFDWDLFTEGDQEPFVEIYSRHGLAESDQGDYNYLHDMGPRVWEGSALHGLEKGCKFGMMASTDQHAGYPGSYGDGRIGVLAPSLSREAIWEAMRERRVCAATGDKIVIDFRLNDCVMGQVATGGRRNIYLFVEGSNYIDYVDIVKNGRVVARMSAPMETIVPEGDVIRAKVKVNVGWGRDDIRWDGSVEISDGKIVEATPMFRGAPYTAPQQNKLGAGNVDEFRTTVNRVKGQTDRRVDLEMYTVKNPNVLTPQMQGILLDVEMPKEGKITASFNGKTFSYSLKQLLEGTQANFMNGWLSEAIQFNRACPESGFIVEHVMSDDKKERDSDYYYVRVRQRDGQWAWSSPIWVE